MILTPKEEAEMRAKRRENSRRARGMTLEQLQEQLLRNSEIVDPNPWGHSKALEEEPKPSDDPFSPENLATTRSEFARKGAEEAIRNLQAAAERRRQGLPPLVVR